MSFHRNRRTHSPINSAHAALVLALAVPSRAVRRLHELPAWCMSESAEHGFFDELPDRPARHR